MTLTTCELMWLKHLLHVLHFCKVGPIKIVCDNQSALHLFPNIGQSIKKLTTPLLKEKKIFLESSKLLVNSKDQLVNIFTKSLWLTQTFCM